MNKAAAFIVLILSFLCACRNNKTSGSISGSATDSLSYKYISLKKRAPDCGSKADTDCTVAKFRYPVFEGHKALNDTIISRLATMFQLNEKLDTNLDSLISRFFNNYLADKKDRGTEGIFYSLDCDSKVLMLDSSLAVIKTKGYIFAGGAHPSEYTGYINWNTHSDKLIAIADLIAPANLEKFTKVAESIFRKNEELSDTTSLERNYFFKDGKFALANTFSLSRKGIIFFYNQYEIKSYAEGTTELFVPYNKINLLLRPNTVAAQYIK